MNLIPKEAIIDENKLIFDNYNRVLVLYRIVFMVISGFIFTPFFLLKNADRMKHIFTALLIITILNVLYLLMDL